MTKNQGTHCGWWQLKDTQLSKANLTMPGARESGGAVLPLWPYWIATLPSPPLPSVMLWDGYPPPRGPITALTAICEL